MDLHHLIATSAFLILVLTMLAVDLFVLHRKPHEIHFKEALVGVLIPVTMALLFVPFTYFIYKSNYLPPPQNFPADSLKFYPSSGGEAAIMYLTGYLVELSLSADNVFLFVVLMTFFRVPRHLQHRVLFWGIIGALVMRGIMIFAGAALLMRFHWIIYIFGAFLIFTGVKMLFGGEPKDPADNIAIRLVRRFLPVSDGFDGKKFFTRVNGKRCATTLFLVLVCIEFTDLVFALDSIPAIFGITLDWFIVFTSNVFAILGLRSMYFLLAGVIDRFHLLKYGLSLVLGFVGVKMVLPGAAYLYNRYAGGHHEWHLNQFVSLGFIVVCLAGSIIASLIFPPARHHKNPLDREQNGPSDKSQPLS